jgi:hypothetical protein
MKWIVKIGDATSQLANVVFLNGHPNESLSGRAWRTKSIWYKVIDTVLWFDKDHCKNSHYNDVRYARELISKFPV